MQIEDTLSNNQKGRGISPRRYRNVHALPVLKPSYQTITSQNVVFDAETTNKFGLVKESVNLAFYNHQRISKLVTLCIEENVLTGEQSVKLLKSFENENNFLNTLSHLEKTISEHLSSIVKQPIKKLTDKLISLGYDLSIIDVGKFHYDNSEEDSLCFIIDEVLQYWVINVEGMSSELQDIVVGAARLFGGLAHIDTLCHSILDYEVYYSISSLSKRKKQKLYDTNLDQEPSTIMKEWRRILGKKLYEEVIEAYCEYYGWEVDSEDSTHEIINHIHEAILSVKFDEHRFFQNKLSFNASNIPRLYRLINKFLTVSESEKERKLAAKIKLLAQLTKREVTRSEYDFTYTGELTDISGQQLMHFQGQELEEKSEQRLKSIGNYLMETCENANMILKPLDRKCVECFKDIQIGWLMITVLIQDLEKHHD